MIFSDFILAILEVIIIMPVGIMCLFAFSKSTKKPKLCMWLYAGIFSLVSVAGGTLRYFLSYNINIIVSVFSLLSLLYLFVAVKESKLKILYMFMSLGAVVSSFRLYGYFLEANIDNSKSFLAVQSWGLLLRAVLTAFLILSFILFISKIRWLTSCRELNGIWRFVWLVPFIFTCANIIMMPHDFYLLELGRINSIYIIITSVLFVMHILYQLMLYFIAKTVTEKAELDKQAQLLSIQASQYEGLQRHIEATSKLRHDFKHTARTAVKLAQKGDNDALIKLLSDYGVATASTDKQSVFTKNSTLNALICYYYEQALSKNIFCNWQVSLPEKLGVEDIDLYGIIGNLLENAIHASESESAENRYINLKADIEDNGDIYIVTTNGFCGKIKKDRDKYLSTKKDGSGIGIESIKTTVERYSGYAGFYNDTKTFYADIMLKQNLQ